jgi:CDP-2,3-bis-(O-geranylgeranyl)-sn-glycerol synthase
MMQLFPILQALILLTCANGTPVIVKKIAGRHLAVPLDAGLQFFDGRPLFGKSKTLRGVVASIAITAVSRRCSA